MWNGREIDVDVPLVIFDGQNRTVKLISQARVRPQFNCVYGELSVTTRGLCGLGKAPQHIGP